MKPNDQYLVTAGWGGGGGGGNFLLQEETSNRSRMRDSHLRGEQEHGEITPWSKSSRIVTAGSRLHLS